jgi:hypothetical protein
MAQQLTRDARKQIARLESRSVGLPGSSAYQPEQLTGEVGFTLTGEVLQHL